LLQGGPQLPVLLAELLAVVEQLVARGSASVPVGDGLLNLLRVFIGGLPATAGPFGLLGDGPPAAAQDRGGVANPGKDS
jgi:hypothetical protein